MYLVILINEQLITYWKIFALKNFTFKSFDVKYDIKEEIFFFFDLFFLFLLKMSIKVFFLLIDDRKLILNICGQKTFFIL